MADTKTEQGYGWPHQQERSRWAKAIGREGGAVCMADQCLMRTRWISPDDPWDLGHHPGQQTWRGPEHVKCNRSAGARNSNRGGNPGRGAARRRRRRRAELIEVSVDVSDL